MYRAKKGEMVYVRWLDSTHAEWSQKEKEALSNRHTMDCESVGFYLGRRDDMHVIAHFRYTDGSDNGGHTVKYVNYIPARAVKEIKKLRPLGERSRRR